MQTPEVEAMSSPVNEGPLSAPAFSLADSRGVAKRLFDRVSAVVRGRDDVIELVLISLIADGHILLEDFPGSGKTTLAKALGEAIVDDRPEQIRGLVQAFRRIQFTPDLLPSDVTGTTIFEPKSGEFSFRPGPIFAHVVLADEINRTSPKVQAAMLEAMAEKQVTVDNQTRELDGLFFVIATQNPLDLAGTYPLPVAQLDRFLFKIRMTHIDRAAELDVLRTMQVRKSGAAAVLPSITRSEILKARNAVENGVRVHEMVQEGLVDIATHLRLDRRVLQGVSTRSLVLAVPALQVRAMMYGRDYVDSDDLQVILPKVFAHRLELSAGVDEAPGVIEDAMNPVLERIARTMM